MNSDKILDHAFIKEWRDLQMITMKKIYPQISEDKLLSILNDQIKKRCVDANATLHNNYERRTIKTTLLNVVDWIKDTKPIIAGFGTFFSNQDKVFNPLALMVDGFLIQRSKYKSNLKIYERTDSLYTKFDRLQLVEKISCNSIYGGLGCPSFKAYNLYTAAAITSTGQMLISTARACFESFLCNTDKFIDLDECIQFIMFVLKSENTMPIDWVEKKTYLDVYERLRRNFKSFKDEYKQPLLNLLKDLPEELLTRIYYKNNLYEVMECPKVRNVLVNILRVVNTTEGIANPKPSYTVDPKGKGDAWEFVSCEHVPYNIKDNLETLHDILLDFVYTNIIMYDRIHRNRVDIRKTITAQDTDSVMTSLYQWCLFCEKIEKEENICQNISPDLMMFAHANTMASCLTKVIRKSMYNYTSHSNILERYKGRINMKNEFLFDIQILSNVKKRYISRQLLREGVVIPGGKVDIKGHEFMKSTTTEDTKEEFMKIVEKYILSGNINVPAVTEEVQRMEKDIFNSLKSGEKKHLTPAKVNPAESYKYPLRMMGFRAVLAWNICYPHKEIQLPDDIDMVKTKIKSVEDIEFIKEYDMDVYNNIYNGIFHNKNEEIVEKGIQVIAIPRNEPVPEWIKAAIDVDTVSSNTLSKFYPVLNSLCIKIYGKKSANNKAYYSNIIEF